MTRAKLPTFGDNLGRFTCFIPRVQLVRRKMELSFSTTVIR